MPAMPYAAPTAAPLTALDGRAVGLSNLAHQVAEVERLAGLAAGFGEIRPVLGSALSLALLGTLLTAIVNGHEDIVDVLLERRGTR